MERLNYNESFAAYYKWQVAANAAFVAAIFIAGMAEAALGENGAGALVIGGAIVAIAMYIKGIMVMAEKWPTGEGKPFFWGGLKVTFLNYGLLGYRKEPISNLPWKAVFTWGYAVIFVSPSIIGLLLSGQIQQFVESVIVSMMLIPIAVVLMYGIGRFFGLLFNRG